MRINCVCFYSQHTPLADEMKQGDFPADDGSPSSNHNNEGALVLAGTSGLQAQQTPQGNEQFWFHLF